MTPRRLGAAALLLIAGQSDLRAQVQRYYETDYAFYARQASEQSMDNIRAIQRIETARREAYAKIGQVRIAGGRASTDFAISPAFSVTAHLLKIANEEPTAKAWVPIITAQADPAKQQYLAQMAQASLRRDNFVDCVSFIFQRNFEILTGTTIPVPFVRRQLVDLDRTLLADPIFQGTSDLERQTRSEALGVQTVYAMNQMALGKAGNGAAGATARQIATGILTTILGSAPTPALLASIGRGEMPAPTQPGVAAAAPVIAPGGPPVEQGIAGARLTYRYNTDLAVARNVAVESLEHFSTEYAQQLLDRFYQQISARGGQRNNLADVAALLVFANYFVVSDGKELSPLQYAGVREMFRQRILASESIQQSVDTDIQFQTEKEIIQTANNYSNFLRDRAVLARGVKGERWQGEYFGASGLVRSQRSVAMSSLDLLFSPDKFRTFRLTPTGFTK